MNELERWSKVKDEFIIIQNFLQIISAQGKNLCKFRENTSINGGQYLPIMERYSDLIMKYLEIDQDKLEKERNELLESLQKWMKS